MASRLGHLAGLIFLAGCTEQDVQWYGFWVFMAVMLVAGAVKLWSKR